MNTLKSTREKEKSCASEPYRFTKRLGSIVYEVSVHFNQDAKETMDDKIIRLMRADLWGPREVPQGLCGERRSNEAERMPELVRAERSEVCDDDEAAS